MKSRLNYIDYLHKSIGNERRLEMLNDILNNGTFLPKTVVYKDIDESFKNWVNSIKISSDEGKYFPTLVLFSNQRFSEYMQTWKHTDANNNILLNFKSITRENNPKPGKIQSGFWNIPGERFYTMKRMPVLDDNGCESLLILKMKQPVAVDLIYKLSIFTNKYDKINEFNEYINKVFASRQCYVSPNGHNMPMTLEDIGDESQYNIDDRQYYSQTYTIKVMAYIIMENDFRTEEVPLKRLINVGVAKHHTRGPIVEIEEIEDEVIEVDECHPDEKYYYQPIVLSITFPPCKNRVRFTIDTNFTVIDSEMENIKNIEYVKVNGNTVVDITKLDVVDGDVIDIKILRGTVDIKSKLALNGYNNSEVFDSDVDSNTELDTDNPQKGEIIEIK